MTDTIADGLKPCPFCGGAAELKHDERGAQYPTWFIICPPCDLIRDQAYGCKTAAEAIAAWNTRLAPNASVPAELVERAKALAFAGEGAPDDLGVDIVTMNLRNPDGPELFDIVEKLASMPPAGRVEELEQRLRALHEALTPSTETKAAYIGEFSFTIEEGEYGSRIILVPWTTIKEIMAAIIGRAALSGEGR